jgi:serine/arginine repetitive matrix protein 2
VKVNSGLEVVSFIKYLCTLQSLPLNKMYNGIGLTTPRGSGTSGHVVKNVSYLRPEFFRNKIDANTGKQNGFNAQGLVNSVGNKEILDHNKKREIESKLYELQETMIEQGYTDIEIEEKLAEVRKSHERIGAGALTKTSKSSNDSHVRESLKKEENLRIRSAFGIKSNFAEGDSFNEERIAAERTERITERETRDKKRREEREINDKADSDRKKTTERQRSDRDGGDDKDKDSSIRRDRNRARDSGDDRDVDRRDRRNRSRGRDDRRSRDRGRGDRKSRSRSNGRESSRRNRS